LLHSIGAKRLPSRASTQTLFRTFAERCFDADSDAKVDAISDAITDAKVVGFSPKGGAKLRKTYSKTRFKVYMLEYQHFALFPGMKTGKLPRFLEAISHA
jgi:hypothetical protein